MELGQFLSARLGVTTYDLQLSEDHNSFVRTLLRVFLDSMESPLSQESIHMLEKDSRYQTEFAKVRSAKSVQVSSAGCDYV